jgi:hypothetical protein
MYGFLLLSVSIAVTETGIVVLGEPIKAGFPD